MSSTGTNYPPKVPNISYILPFLLVHAKPSHAASDKTFSKSYPKQQKLASEVWKFELLLLAKK